MDPVITYTFASLCELVNVCFMEAQANSLCYKYKHIFGFYYNAIPFTIILSIFVRRFPKSIVAVKLDTVAFWIADIENGMPIVVLKFP